MADPGFVSAFIGVGIDLAIKEMLRHINISVRCKKELESLRDLLISLQDINSDMQMYRTALNSGRVDPSESFRPESVDNWLRKLDILLEEAAGMVRECTIPRYYMVSRYRTSKNISRMITRIKEHLEKSTLMVFVTQLAQSLRQDQETRREMIPSSCFSSAPPLTQSTVYIGEQLVLGQDMVLTRLQELAQNTSRIGVLGAGGSGKTLLLKRLFNSQQVQGLFSSDLLLWLTVSQTPSFHVLRQELVKQISLKLNKRIERLEGEQVKTWLQSELSEKKFMLFLDDVWETSASSLLEELALPSLNPASSKVIVVSSRDRRVLLQVGVPGSSIIDMQYLTLNDSWRLFGHHAFPHSDGKLPASISEEIARGICKECGGLPLAIKVIAGSMAGVLNSKEWEFTLRRLQNAQIARDSLYCRLRLSYDSLAKINISLQLCFLCVAAYQEDKVIHTFEVSQLWMGEGLLEGKDQGLLEEEDQLQIGQTYLNMLADRCLIEAIKKDIYGNVLYFRVHDVLYDMARQIAEKEENCFFRAGKCFQQFSAIDRSRHIRISLANCSLGSVPKTFGGPDMRSWRMDGNHDLQIIPGKVIKRMTSLKFLDLSCTSLQSLPDSIGSLKHLVCLMLGGVPIKRLPHSITSLKKLQVLNLHDSDIQQLPSTISKLSSLKILDISNCKDLQSIPYGVSQLISLEFLRAAGCANAWIEAGRSKSKRDLLSINDLSSLKLLRMLHLEYSGETLEEGTLGSLLDMEMLLLCLRVMENLPEEMTAMSKLRKLMLTCPRLTKMELTFSEFQHLGFLSLWGCQMLKEVPADLHKIVSLKELHITKCPNIEKLPHDFGERGAFPMLEVFSLMGLDMLEELPTVEEAAMPSLKTFTVALCERLKMIPENYWNLRSVEKIRVYGCSMAFKELEENFRATIKHVQTITMTTAETRTFSTKYDELWERGRGFWEYGEQWSNEFFVFLNDIDVIPIMM